MPQCGRRGRRWDRMGCHPCQGTAVDLPERIRTLTLIRIPTTLTSTSRTLLSAPAPAPRQTLAAPNPSTLALRTRQDRCEESLARASGVLHLDPLVLIPTVLHRRQDTTPDPPHSTASLRKDTIRITRRTGPGTPEGLLLPTPSTTRMACQDIVPIPVVFPTSTPSSLPPSRTPSPTRDLALPRQLSTPRRRIHPARLNHHLTVVELLPPAHTTLPIIPTIPAPPPTRPPTLPTSNLATVSRRSARRRLPAVPLSPPPLQLVDSRASTKLESRNSDATSSGSRR
jgi:hypothetical protein